MSNNTTYVDKCPSRRYMSIVYHFSNQNWKIEIQSYYVANTLCEIKILFDKLLPQFFKNVLLISHSIVIYITGEYKI